MAKTKKLANDPNAATENPENAAPAATASATKGRKPGKDIVPRLKVIDGQSFILMASSRANKMKTGLLWAPQPKDPENNFCFMFDLPSGDDDEGSIVVSVPMGEKQAQAVYAAHPRRVPIHEMPPECSLIAVVDDEPKPTPAPE